MLKIGSHVSMNGPDYFLGSVKEAVSYGETAFMFYTGAPQNTYRTPVEQLKVEEAKELLSKSEIQLEDVVVHAPYLINLGNLDKEKSEVSYNILLNEMDRTLKIGCHYLVLHPGASIKYDRNESISQIASYLNKAFEIYPDIKLLLETMAGKGSEIGCTFEEIAAIISKIDNKNCIGVCLDTCHINDAGYDVSKADETLDLFDKTIGLDYLYVVHVNDSKNEIGAHKDRHENIGFGHIGFDAIVNFVYNPRIHDRIFILETPYVKENEKDKISYPPYKFEVEAIRNKKFNDNLYQDVINYYKGV